MTVVHTLRVRGDWVQLPAARPIHYFNLNKYNLMSEKPQFIDRNKEQIKMLEEAIRKQEERKKSSGLSANNNHSNNKLPTKQVSPLTSEKSSEKPQFIDRNKEQIKMLDEALKKRGITE